MAKICTKLGRVLVFYANFKFSNFENFQSKIFKIFFGGREKIGEREENFTMYVLYFSGARLHRLDPNQLIKLKVEMSLTQVSLELVKGDQTLIKGNSSSKLCNFEYYYYYQFLDLTTFVKMTPHKVFIKAECVAIFSNITS